LVEIIGSLIWSLSNPRKKIDLLYPLEDDQTCSTMVGELCGFLDNRSEAHGDEMEGLQGIVEVTILSHRL